MTNKIQALIVIAVGLLGVRLAQLTPSAFKTGLNSNSKAGGHGLRAVAH